MNKATKKKITQKLFLLRKVISLLCLLFARTVGVLHLQNASSLDAQDVLVDADGHLVLQDAPGTAAEGAQVIGHEKGSSHDRPQSHLGTRLVHAEAKVTYNQL